MTFHVYCEGLTPIRPISVTHSLANLRLARAAHYILEPTKPTHINFNFGYYVPKPDSVVNYYSMVRPTGDTNVEQYLERRTAQLFVNIYKVSDPSKPHAVISAPEMLPVTELPKFILFATRERYDPKTDTLQLFRRRVNSEINEVTPYVVRDGVLHF